MFGRSVPIIGWTVLYFGIKLWEGWKKQEKRTEEANALARSAQLQMLRHQLNPHFLFNSLNSIRALVDEDEKKAGEMVTELSQFLRYSLDIKDFYDVPLRIELEAIRYYFAIQKKRYEDKLLVEFDIEPEAESYPVLSFLIHPLVENAVKYGMRAGTLPLQVRIEAGVKGGQLGIRISNTGKWIKPADGDEGNFSGTGTGLDNVRKRLENAFPGQWRLTTVEKEGWVHVQLDIGPRKGISDEEVLQSSDHR
jgi:LytS/YehU family sensor histidine kinase